MWFFTAGSYHQILTGYLLFSDNSVTALKSTMALMAVPELFEVPPTEVETSTGFLQWKTTERIIYLVGCVQQIDITCG